jgi:prepilin-type N-terminal cleavage/methylation domain-containing protein
MNSLFLQREKGFTILEVVFAVSILAIGIMGYTSLKISNRHSWFFAKNMTQAVQLTAASLESLLMAGYKDDGWLSDGDHSVTVNADGTITEVGGVNAAGELPFLSTKNLDLGPDEALDLGDTTRGIVRNSSSFTASGVTWTVREGCPSELSKLVTYTTNWNNGNNGLTITQVQVRP